MKTQLETSLRKGEREREIERTEKSFENLPTEKNFFEMSMLTGNRVCGCGFARSTQFQAQKVNIIISKFRRRLAIINLY